MKKSLWCIIAEIPQNTIFMMETPIRAFFDLWPKMGLGDKINHYFTLYKGDFSVMCYLRKEFDAEADFLANKMIKNPRWAIDLISRIEKASKEFFKYSARQRKYDLKTLSDRELIRVYKLPYKYHLFSHGVGASVSWHADCDKERVTKAILKMVEEQIKTKKLNLSAPAVFSILSTPTQESIVAREEAEFLRLAQKKNRQSVTRHYEKYCWIPYQYKGPAYSLKDFLDRWQALLSSKQSPAELLNTIKKNKQKLFSEQKNLLKKLKFNNYQLQLIKLAQALVHIKEYRKMALYHGMYCYESVFKEIGRRLELSFNQMTALNYWEIPEALLKHKYNENELNLRLKECAAYYDGKKYVVHVGEDFKKFMAKIKFEKIKIKKTNELRGTCACPGKVRGTVKIINLPEEMNKMKQGDILVAYNTNPNLVPAMKKAGALVSESGGLTCHTAIVARELKIPCVVGVPQADKILKDGDLVEVDATSGVVRKL